MPRLTVIGIGSDFADDRVGWNVVEALSASREIAAYGNDVLVKTCLSPAGELLSLLANTEVAILVDSVSFSGAPGTVYRLDGVGSPMTAPNFISSHGMDLPILLALAAALEQSPREMILYGIEAGPCFVADSKMGQSVLHAVKWVTEDIKRDISNYCESENR